MSSDNKSSRLSITFIFGIVTILLAGSLFMGTASAITNGQPDGDGHPAVCAVAVFDDTFAYIGFGSGTLISPNVVLTAGHVTDLAYITVVYFGEDVMNSPEFMVLGAPHTYPGFFMSPSMAGGLFNFHGDVGVIVLDEAVPNSVVSPAEYGVLPDVGMVDTLTKKA